MADFIYNLLEIECDKSTLARFHHVFMSKDDELTLSLQSIVPQPVELLFKQEIDTMDSDLYNWRIVNWGVKWDTFNPCKKVYKNDDYQIYFQTAWNIPLPAMKKLSSTLKDVKLNLYYAHECIGRWSGAITLLNGEIISSEEYSYCHEAYVLYLKARNFDVGDVDELTVDENNMLVYDDPDDESVTICSNVLLISEITNRFLSSLSAKSFK